MLGRLICLDIETVPDPDLVPSNPPPEKIPKPFAHRIVAISFVEAAIERQGGLERYRVETCRSGGNRDADERQLLAGFWRHFARTSPRLVTWNGRGFDLAVLKLRAMVHGIAAPHFHRAGDKWNNYTQRFAAEWHCDLMEVLSDYGASTRTGLDEMARAMGLPGKLGGSGAEVASMVAEGRIDDVRAYCEGDVLNLFALYVRWAFLSGRTDAAGHNASLESLVSYLAAERAERPHLGQFLDLWQASARPCPMDVAPGPPPLGEALHLDSEDVLA